MSLLPLHFQNRNPLKQAWRYPLAFLWNIREILLIAGAYLGHMFARKLLLADVADLARDNAVRIVNIESDLGIFWEPRWQSWVIEHAGWIATFLNWTYILGFFPIIGLTAFIYHFRDNPRYLHYRNILLVSLVVALFGFVLFPLAPPRLITDLDFNFVDTILVYGPKAYASREMAAWYTIHAAMPSLHFGWSAMLGVLFFRTRGKWWASPWLKLLGVAYPTLTFFAITITGNHYVLDAAGGIGVMIVSFLLYEGFRRWRATGYARNSRLKLVNRMNKIRRNRPRLPALPLPRIPAKP